jgi:excisionase family DNA binding protein
MSSPGSAPSDLIRPDGSVLIPAEVAGDVLRSLVRDLTARVRADGGEVGPVVRRVLYALHAAAQRPDHSTVEHSSDNGTSPGTAATVEEVTASEAAALLGCTPGYVRRLVRNGTLTGRRRGARAWAIDRAALDTYRHRSATP